MGKVLESENERERESKNRTLAKAESRPTTPPGYARDTKSVAATVDC